MQYRKISVGRVSITIGELTAQQVARSFGAAALANIFAPPPPGGSTQEEAYTASEEYKVDYDKYLSELNRVELLGMLTWARDPNFIYLSDSKEAADNMLAENLIIEEASNRSGWKKDERYPDFITIADQIVYIVEKNAKMFPEAFNEISKFSVDCMRLIGFVGGEAIDAEIKSEKTDDQRPIATEVSVLSASEAEDPVREALPTA